jgi:hypothetical protein
MRRNIAPDIDGNRNIMAQQRLREPQIRPFQRRNGKNTEARVGRERGW